jgi:hypothetical protein
VRPPQAPPRDAVAPDERDDYDAVVARALGKFGRLPPYHAALLNSPPFAAALNAVGLVVRAAGKRPDSYSHAERELVDQVLSADFGTNVLQRIHVPDAVAAGVRVEAIRALRADDESGLSEDERQLAAYVRAVVSGSVADEQYEAIEARLGARGAVEYTIFIAFLQMTIRLWQAFGMDDPSDAEIDATVAELASGARDLDGFRKRIG